MSNTFRKDYTGRVIRDGQWGKRCPEGDCPVCVTGVEKRAWNRKKRREAL